MVYSWELQSVQHKIYALCKSQFFVTKCVEFNWICIHWVPPWSQAGGQQHLKQHSESYLRLSPHLESHPIRMLLVSMSSLSTSTSVCGSNQCSPFESSNTFLHHFISIHCVSTIRLETPILTWVCCLFCTEFWSYSIFKFERGAWQLGEPMHLGLSGTFLVLALKAPHLEKPQTPGKIVGNFMSSH